MTISATAAAAASRFCARRSLLAAAASSTAGRARPVYSGGIGIGIGGASCSSAVAPGSFPLARRNFGSGAGAGGSDDDGGGASPPSRRTSGRTVFLTAPPPTGISDASAHAAGVLGAGFSSSDPLHVAVGAQGPHPQPLNAGGVSYGPQSRSLSHSADGSGGGGGGGGSGTKDDEGTAKEASWKGEGQTAVFGNNDGGGGSEGTNGSLPPDTTLPSSSPSPRPRARRSRRKKNHYLDPSVLEHALQQPAGLLVDDDEDAIEVDDDDGSTSSVIPKKSKYFIPQVALHAGERRQRRRVLVLCTGGTLTMAPDPSREGALAPVEGAVTAYMREMRELHAENMPEVVAHEYSPFFDSSDMGPSDWALLANDIKANYLHFDGFVVLMGTDTMAYAATALSFMLENLGKPVVFTGSQIPLCEPYNDARRNLIMALIFASRDTINEVSIFFHDRLIRACRATKVNTHRLLAFDSPNLDPLAKIGITIDENEHLVLPPARGALRVHANMDTRLLTVRLVPGFDDSVIKQLIDAGSAEGTLRALVLQLYGTGNVPSVKEDFVRYLAEAREKGILVVASTQCFTGSVMMGHYATGQALKKAGVVSASDMTLEAIACKCAYLFGRGDLSNEEVANLMAVSLRGEVTPPEALSPPPLSSAYQRASRKGKRYY